jgi:hypothetical protein
MVGNDGQAIASYLTRDQAQKKSTGFFDIVGSLRSLRCFLGVKCRAQQHGEQFGVVLRGQFSKCNREPGAKSCFSA